MQKYLFLVVVLGLLAFKTSAQQDTTVIEPEDIISLGDEATVFEQPLLVIPKSPGAAAFDQYINTPVNGATGVPEISIPIYTVKIKGLDVPISLSYHASGVKVDDIATPVGLKWVLNAGGMISRNIIGRTDEDQGWLTIEEDDLTSCRDEVLKGFYTNKKDPSPDIFSYSFLNKQGSFFFNRDSTLLKTLLDEVEIKPSSYNSQMKFTARDERGNTYFFEDCESTHISVSGVGRLRNGTGVTGWRISKIITAANDSVIFRYKPYTYSAGGGDVYSSSEYIRSKIGATTRYPNEGLHKSQTIITYQTMFLDEIITRNQKISFEHENDPGLSIMQMKLKEIVVAGFNANDTLLTVKLIHDKFQGDPRLKLTGIEFIGKDSEAAKKKYGFSYDGYGLEQYGSHKRDIFGYFNDNTVTHMIPANQGDLTYFNLTPANREISESAVTKGLLTGIVFPTGGRVKYTYTANKDVRSTDTRYAPGTCVKVIEHFDADGTLVKKNEYQYEGLTGNDIHVPGIYYFRFKSTSGGFPKQLYDIFKWTSDPIQELQLMSQFLHGFYYKDVTTESVGNEGDFSIREKFLGSKDNFNTKPLLTRREYLNKDGEMLKKSIFEYANTINDRTDVYARTLTNSYVFSGYYRDCLGDLYYSTVEEGFMTHYKPLSFLFYVSQLSLKTKEINIDYFNNGIDSVYTETDFEYNENTLVSKTSTLISSTSDTIKKTRTTKYVTDYALSGVSWMDEMKAKHMIGIPIDMRTYVHKNQQDKLISGHTFVYDGNGMLTENHQWEGATPPLQGWDSNILLSEDFKLENEYQYNPATNDLIQFWKKDNNSTSLIWAYNQTYPVVKAENIDHNTLKAAVEDVAGTSDLEAFWKNFTDLTYTNSAWNNFNKDLRKMSSLKDAIITTYTYKPLVGITSETDPSGRTMYYEYDNFGRLQYVRDHKGNIIKTHDYQYYKLTINE